MTKRTVLLTGATGYIAQQLLPVFRERYDLRLIDVKQERDGQIVEGVAVADLLRDDPSTLAPFFSGVDAVVHTGYTRSSRLKAKHPNPKQKSVSRLDRVVGVPCRLLIPKERCLVIITDYRGNQPSQNEG